MVKKGGTVSAKLYALPRYQKYRIEVSQILMTFNCQRRGPKQDPPGRLSGDFRIHKL